MGKINIKSYIIELVKYNRDNQNNPLIWKILFVLEQIIIGGKKRKIVTSAIIKRVSNIISYYLPCPYRPKGIIYSVEQWFNDSIPLQMEGSWIKEIIPEHSLHLNKPNQTNNYTKPAFNFDDLNILIPKTYLCLLKNAKLMNENAVVISSDNKVFNDFTFEFDKSVENNKVFKKYIKKPQVLKGCYATITSTGSTGYFHWIFESVPRLMLLWEMIDKIDYLIVPNDLNKFHLETLNILGFKENKLYRMKDGIHIQCENLFVPSLSLISIPKWKCDFLKKLFIPNNSNNNKQRLIYITRNDALYRKIYNEKEVESYLKGIGFEIINMSEFSFLEQVQICSEARVVVGPHGAGLSNTVFCQNAKILEICSPSYNSGSFWALSNQVGNEYYYILGEDVSGKSPPQWRDFKINMEDLINVVEKIV